MKENPSTARRHLQHPQGLLAVQPAHDGARTARAVAPLGADIVFLQEVQGMHLRTPKIIDNWPEEPQHEFLAEDVWQSTAYGSNVIYDHGHHGNAILSRFPIDHSSQPGRHASPFERRGLLHCRSTARPAPLPCTASASTSRCSRVRASAADDRAGRAIWKASPDGTPLIIAGDFNDWRN
jgi:endonuclease/exonuclease/phosphatase family metal-dependent hydrolase